MSAGTGRRTVRVADPLWAAALAVSTYRGDTISDVIREALERYTAGVHVIRYRPDGRPVCSVCQWAGDDAGDAGIVAARAHCEKWKDAAEWR